MNIETNYSNQQTKKNNPTGLYVITHHDGLTFEKLISDITATLQGGANTVQFRDKTSSIKEKLKRARALQTLCKNYKATFIINDDVELCKTINADGVHLGQADSSIECARHLLGENKIIGATCHGSLDLALAAQQLGANYIALGSFFSSQTKSTAQPVDISCIKIIKARCTLPIVAIGGITLDNAPALIEQGVHTIAVINDLFSHDNIQVRAQDFSALFK